MSRRLEVSSSASRSRTGKWAALLAASIQTLLTCACGGGGGGSTPPPPVATPNPAPKPPSTLIENPQPVCETRAEYTLCIRVQDTRTRTETVGLMKERFFDVYPTLVDRFNPAAPHSVDFVIGPADFIAGASGHEVLYRTEWMLEHPEDYDVVVHEVMHLVQNYASSPGWITEGIADYVRYHYGVNNLAAGWSLQMPAVGSSYTAGYGTAARFFLWVEARYGIDLVDMLDATIRSGSYVPSLWISYTGKSVDQLWSDYLADPVLEPATAPS